MAECHDEFQPRESITTLSGKVCFTSNSQVATFAERAVSSVQVRNMSGQTLHVSIEVRLNGHLDIAIRAT